jgi:Sensors of blue-light using FAD
MQLVQMIYVSTVQAELDLNQLAKVAQANNAKHGLSGVLAFDSQFFIQVLEGERSKVSRLLGNLFADRRHKDLVVLGVDAIDIREFDRWSMLFVPLDKATKAKLFRHNLSATFDPYAYSKEAALSLLRDIPH